MIICHCFGVTESQIEKHKTLRRVRKNTNATLGCGSCLTTVKCLLRDKKKLNTNGVEDKLV